MVNRPNDPFTPPVPRDHADATFSEMVPFRSTKINLFKSPLVIIAILCGLVVPFLFYQINGIMRAQINNAPPQEVLAKMQSFTLVTVFFVIALICVFVYLYVRPKRSIWAYVPALAFSAAALSLPFIFEPYRYLFRTLPFGSMQQIQVNLEAGGFTTFYTMLLIAGMCEEALKATPILLGAWITFMGYRNPAMTQGGLYRALHVRGPLDGALMGVFAGGGFVLMETGLEYVANTMAPIIQQGGSISLASTQALLVLIPRLLGSLTGHMAYAGIFGYFIGLAVIRPRAKWKLLLIGYATASILHGIWNSYASEIPFGYYIVAVVSAVGLAAVVLKARQLEVAAGGASGETGGSIIVDPRTAPPVMPAAPAGMPVQPAPMTAPPAAPQAYAPPPQAAPPAQAAPPPQAAAAEVLGLNIDGMMMPLRAGARLDLGAEPALGGRGAGILGTIIPHPTRPNVLGLKNEGMTGWRAKLRDGSQQMIEHDQSIRLAAGVEILFADGLNGAVVKLG